MLEKITATELRNKIDSAEISANEVYEYYSKIIDEKEPEINAFISVTKDLAKNSLVEGDNSGCLYGIPVSVKDNISLKGAPLTCASKMLSGYECVYDATVVSKLKAQGAMLMGKTNMDEFAMGGTTRTSYYGVTKNPLNTELIPGGSSGGAAASVASGEVLLALGTDTGGSVRQPAAYCGVVGFKPTYGSISRYGVVPMGNTLDTVGIIANNVEDALRLFDVIKGQDVKDATSRAEANRKFDLDEILANTDLSKFKVAVPSFALTGLDSDYEDIFNKIVNKLKSVCQTVDIVEMPNTIYANQVYHIVANAEISSNLSRFDGLLYGHRSDKFDSIDEMYIKTRSEGFGDEVKRRIMIGTHILSMESSEDYYEHASKVRTKISEEFNDVFSKYDIIITPTAPTKPFKLEAEMRAVDVYKADLFTEPSNLVGNTAISIPFSMKDGLSFGLQVIADKFKEETLFSFSKAIELEVREHVI